MPSYRDIGYLSDDTQILVPVATNKYTQVYGATHDGADGNRLPYMERSFISFTYGGKHIEDFNLIATIDGDRMDGSIYAEFNDNITSSNVIDGQMFWDSHYKPNTLDLRLSTDGITEQQLDQFKRWFKPGFARELIRAEHPNRAIMARVSKAPTYAVIPFEEQTSITVAGTSYKTKTTLYKGEINLSFVMDDPFWYSLTNVLATKDAQDTYVNEWTDANGNLSPVTSVNEDESSQDALKIVLEDNVPTAEMLTGVSGVMMFGLGRLLAINESVSTVGIAQVNHAYTAYVFNDSTEAFTLNKSDDLADPDYCLNFYYAGTAPCYPCFKFTLTPEIDPNTGYLTSPLNRFNGSSNTYNTIVFESTDKFEFKFTTPNLYDAYNQVIAILNISEDAEWTKIKAMIRDSVTHYAPREYAIAAIDDYRSDHTGNTMDSTALAALLTTMMSFFTYNNAILSSVFIVNSQLGEVKAQLQYKKFDGTKETLEENVSDMVLSKYLKIEDRNYPTSTGMIDTWSTQHPEYSYRVYTNVSGGLTNVGMQYKYLYL